MKSRKLACGRTIKEIGAPVDVANLTKKLESFVRDRSLNRSASRERVLEVILGLQGHFTAGELASRVQEDHPSVGAATVYRNLPLFVGAGILRESLSDENRQMVYELDTHGHHDHVVCLDCKEIIEFHDESIESSQRKVLSGLGFKESSHRHVVYAHCEFKKG